MGQMLGIVYRVIATHLIKEAGRIHKTAHTGAVKLIQRFGSALNLNIHFQLSFLDGVYVDDANGTRFRWVKVPTIAGLTQPENRIARLTAVVPKPRVKLTRFHGVFAPNSQQPTPCAGKANGAG